MSIVPGIDPAEPAPLRIGTHSGSFHADEVFALAALRIARGPIEIVRTRDLEVLAGCAMRIDVGRRHDPATGDFDHHQGGVGERLNGVGYASFGLVWQEVGVELAGSPEIAHRVDASIVTPIDAGDNGQEVYDPKIEGVTPFMVSGMIAAMNPPWDAEDGAAAERRAFDEAVDIAEGIIRRELASAQAKARAADLVREALRASSDPRILELPQGMPWKSVVIEEAPDVLLAIAPRTRDWGLHAVPAAAHGFANRLTLPEAWGGLEGEELQAVTGVEDAVFCHVARFIAVARSREGVLELARLALGETQDTSAAPAASVAENSEEG